MTLNDTIFKAILAMDAYNRGYHAGIILDTNNQGLSKGQQLGNAIITNESDISESSVEFAAGFYGLSYDLKDGSGNTIEKVISYRGTDYPNENGTAGILPKDILYGWFGGGGLFTPQALAAINFYQDVTGGTDKKGSDLITLTGHSLGGGLAGLVAALYDHDAQIFDSMAYSLAAQNIYSQSSVVGGFLSELIYGGDTPWVPDADGIKPFALEGEILRVNNFIMQTIGSGQLVYPFSSSIDLIENGPGPVNFSLLSGAGYYISETAKEAVARHSLSSLVIRMFANPPETENPTAEELSGGAWEAAEQYFWPVLYDSDFAKRMGLDSDDLSGEFRTSQDFASILRALIAYSAIEQEFTNGVETSKTL